MDYINYPEKLIMMSSYFDIQFDESNNPTFACDPSLVIKNVDVTDFNAIDLNITSLGDFNKFSIVTTLCNDANTRRWVYVGGAWFLVLSPTFRVSFNDKWVPTIYDGQEGLLAQTIDPNSRKGDYEKVLSIDHVSLLDAFGSCYKLIKIKGKWRVVQVPC